nr:helix-turn-helix domain-containing protein [Mesorhizobium loti]
MAKEPTEDGRLSPVEKLLVLGLIRLGLKQAQVAAALGIHRTSLSRAFPKGLLAEVASIKGVKGEDMSNGQETS